MSGKWCDCYNGVDTLRNEEGPSGHLYDKSHCDNSSDMSHMSQGSEQANVVAQKAEISHRR